MSTQDFVNRDSILVAIAGVFYLLAVEASESIDGRLSAAAALIMGFFLVRWVARSIMRLYGPKKVFYTIGVGVAFAITVGLLADFEWIKALKGIPLWVSFLYIFVNLFIRDFIEDQLM